MDISLKRSFTLVEVLIASLIITIVMITVYTAFGSGIFGYRNIEDKITVYQTARSILEHLNQDVRNAIVFSSSESMFEGASDKVSFLSLVDSYRASKMRGSYALVSYYYEDSKLMRLCRKGSEALNIESDSTKPQEVGSDLDIKFEYGYLQINAASAQETLAFKDSWGYETQEESQKLPVALRVRLAVKGRPDEVFERTIYLPVVSDG